MAKYSRTRVLGKRRYRYNYEREMVEVFRKATAEDVEHNEEWRAEFGEDLFRIEDGFVVSKTWNVSREQWDQSDKELLFLELDWEYNEEIEIMMYDLEQEFGDIAI